jgi:uncharacterized zinc-type alcohol dehydrogenase-like protein
MNEERWHHAPSLSGRGLRELTDNGGRDMTMVKAMAAMTAKSPLQPHSYELPALGDEEVEVAVHYCGLCHSDMSMIDNDWQQSSYPLVPGHEVVGEIVAKGGRVPELELGDSVGIGWFSRSCLHCDECLAGDHNLCATAEGTIVGRPGGFATHVRAHWLWVTPLPDGLDPAKAGPLFCGGITVFNPIVQQDIRPTDRVGVVGIGGLGHMALQFLTAWGCHVTAFSTTQAKEAEARELGADEFVATSDPAALASLANSFDMILVTVNVPLDWDAYVAALRPRGRLHIVGAVPSVGAALFPLLMGHKSISASPLGSPVTVGRMLEFAARHGVTPVTETYPLSHVNEAITRLHQGKVRYRAVLQNDLG